MIIDISEDGRTIEWWSNGERKIATIYQLIDAYDGIVRCKDCKHFQEDEGGLFCEYWASLYEDTEPYPQFSPIDFCSRGQRRDEVKE